MQYKEYDRSVSMALKSVRQMKKIKQVVVANVLEIDRSTYSRMENGEIAITPGQLKLIAATLGTSLLEVLTLVDGICGSQVRVPAPAQRSFAGIHPGYAAAEFPNRNNADKTLPLMGQRPERSQRK